MNLVRTFLSIRRSCGLRTAVTTAGDFFREQLARRILVPLVRRLMPLDHQLLTDEQVVALVRSLPVQVSVYKTMGYELAAALAPGWSKRTESGTGEPVRRGLCSRATTQQDMESVWFRYWCGQLGLAPIYHRKLWEYAFALQVLFDHEMLHPGCRGIGFGCGKEPLASYFAAHGVRVTVTDQPDSGATGWQESGQHAATLDHAYHPALVTRVEFDRNVRHQTIDMNRIPPLGPVYDFCWSLCAMEHLGSIERGLRFVENALSILRPGGVAVFTTEFNYRSDAATVDHRTTVLFRRRDFLDLRTRLASAGHEMLDPDFDVGDRPLDRFIDLPPYSSGAPGTAHLKLALQGFPATCFGIVVRKGASG